MPKKRYMHLNETYLVTMMIVRKSEEILYNDKQDLPR
jgi:hypothetical protein